MLSHLPSQKGTVPANEMPPFLLTLGNYVNLGPFRVTTGVLFMIAMYIVLAFALRYTAWGRHVYAVGDDIDAARLAGISVNRVLMSVYVVAGSLSHSQPGSLSAA